MKKMLLTLLALPALTSFADVYGGYGEVQAGSANSSGFNSGVNNAGAARLDAGVKIDQYLGLEAGFTGLTNTTAGDKFTVYSDNSGKPVTITRTSALQFYDVSFKANLPVSEYFNFHGQVGGAYAVALSDATPKLMVGVGFDVGLTKNLALTVNDYGYLDPMLNATSDFGGNTNIVMGGLKVNF